ncbi:hypothetical protein GCM10027569_73560 [Flindersiella endophytica]
MQVGHRVIPGLDTTVPLSIFGRLGDALRRLSDSGELQLASEVPEYVGGYVEVLSVAAGADEHGGSADEAFP